MSNNGTAVLIDEGPIALAEGAPYIVEVTIEGSAPLLFHRWQDAAVEEKAKAAKGSAAKKKDDVESYVYRDAAGVIGMPGVYLHGSLVDPRNGAAKYLQDPRSPRKSALDLYKAAVVPVTDLAPITTVTGDVARTWDYLDSRRATVQRSGITRVRPAFLAGWKTTIQLQVVAPEYVPPVQLHQALALAGRLVGVADFRPVFGRFNIVRFDRIL
jgi:hypothetical protein